MEAKASRTNDLDLVRSNVYKGLCVESF